MLRGKSKMKRPLRRPRRRWEEYIRMDLKEIAINTRFWVYFGSEYGFLERLSECVIEPSGSVSHGVGY